MCPIEFVKSILCARIGLPAFQSTTHTPILFTLFHVSTFETWSWKVFVLWNNSMAAKYDVIGLNANGRVTKSPGTKSLSYTILLQFELQKIWQVTFDIFYPPINKLCYNTKQAKYSLIDVINICHGGPAIIKSQFPAPGTNSTFLEKNLHLECKNIKLKYQIYSLFDINP